MRAMRALVGLLVGCAHQSGHPASDASADADPSACSSAVGTANVVVRPVGPAKVYNRLYAGGTELGGPVQDATGIPFALRLVFANDSPVSPGIGECCSTAGDDCCNVDALVVDVHDLPDGGELGSHTANVSGMDLTTAGVLTITAWSQPLDMPPGHVAGSLSVATPTVTIDGTFDNSFCAGMVGVTI